ncbi:hypothetical protein PENTCL1PPCAC_18471 [Pristionchus entomophagus]|uniref:Uncharacterized protein n=1 Tax=Pristionchus entomophagus TaxID=358040 RepID=A0AAV5TPP3_9BILA|nr:hypothetical protein PENTCL1PPCAC_18471 [Pristionchus entomophagus]
MATLSYHYRDEDAIQTHRHGQHRARLSEATNDRVRLISRGEETVIQCTDRPVSPAKSLREDGNEMNYLDDIALLRRGYINKSSIKAPFTRPQGTSASLPYSKPRADPITLAELESRGLNVNGKVVYTIPRGTKYYSKEARESKANNTTTSQSWLSSSSDASSTASVATLINDAKKPAVKLPDNIQHLPDGTLVEKCPLGKGGVRYMIETNDRITTVQKGKRGSVIFSSLKEQ